MRNLETIGDIGKEQAILFVTAIIGLSNSLDYVWFVFCLIRGLMYYATVDRTHLAISQSCTSFYGNSGASHLLGHWCLSMTNM